MHLVDRRSVTRPTAAEAALEVARAVTLAKFVRFGFTAEQAAAMARADMDVLGVVPLGWSSRPFDEQLAHIGGVRS